MIKKPTLLRGRRHEVRQNITDTLWTLVFSETQVKFTAQKDSFSLRTRHSVRNFLATAYHIIITQFMEFFLRRVLKRRHSYPRTLVRRLRQAEGPSEEPPPPTFSPED